MFPLKRLSGSFLLTLVLTFAALALAVGQAQDDHLSSEEAYFRHLEELMRNPDDQQLWNRELERLQETGMLFERSKTNSLDSSLVDLAISNNLQLQGIALRHLKRFNDALLKLNQSDKALQDLRLREHCRSSNPNPICPQIADQASQLLSFFTSVYIDLQDDRKAESYLTLALASAPTANEYGKQARDATKHCLLNNDLERAVRMGLMVLEQALRLKDSDRLQEASEVMQGVYLEVFRNISWLYLTGERRSNDPRDFVDNLGLAIGADYKYGMTNIDEDDATLVTLLFFKEEVANMKPSAEFAEQAGYESWEALQKNVDVEGYIRQLMADNKFELATKYLYARYIDPGWAVKNSSLECINTNSGTQFVTFGEVERRLASVPPEQVSQNTREMIHLLRTAYDFIMQHCPKRVRGNVR